MKKLNRRDFLKMGALASATGVLASCAQPPEETEAPAAEVAPEEEAEPVVEEAPESAEGVTVQYWYAWGNLDPAMDQIMETESYKEAMKGNSLEYKSAVESEALLTAVAAGTPPDGGSNFPYANLWTRGAVLEVTDLVATSPVVQKDDIAPGLWEGSFYDGKMIGVPGIEGFNWWGMNINANAAEEAGLDPDNIPLTWEGLYEWHQALTKFDDAGNLLQFGLDPYDAMANEPDFAATSFGFKWWDEETGEHDLNNPLMAESMDVMGEFIKYVGPDKFAGLRQVEGNGTWGAAYNAGVQTMIMEGYWHPGDPLRTCASCGRGLSAAQIPCLPRSLTNHRRPTSAATRSRARQSPAEVVIPSSASAMANRSTRSAGISKSSNCGEDTATRLTISSPPGTEPPGARAPASFWTSAAGSAPSR